MEGMSSQEGKCFALLVSRHIDALLFMGWIGVVGLLVCSGKMDQARKAGHMQRWEGLSFPVFLHD
jgi:hypothetical protein